jgi:peptide/nickel transport system substrate-binding protein
VAAITPRFRKLLTQAGVMAVALAAVIGSPAQAAPAQGPAAQQIARKDVLVIPSNVNVPAPDIWNPYIPGTFILQGMNQNMMEPLFMLNYETGNIDGWLAAGFTHNDEQTEWTVTLRQGTEWSDGKPLTSEDVVFTINMLKQYAPQLNWSGAVKQWVNTVEAVDDRTIKFTLTGPNPRFVMENLAGTTSQAIVPLPKHVWEGQDPVTFRNPYNAETGAPIFSGPYTVARFSSTQFDYKRNDNWWGAKTGTFRLPAPLEIRRPWVGDDATRLQMAISNDSDIGGPTTPSQLFAAQAQNPALKSYTDQPPIGWIDPCPRMLTVNTTIAPWDKKEMRWALSYAMNRQQIVDVVNEGAGATSSFIFPIYPALLPYLDAAKETLAPVGEFNLDKSKQLIEGQGYRLDGSGRAAVHGAVGTHGRATVEYGWRRRRAEHPRMGRLPRPDRSRPVPGRYRLGWLRQHCRAVVRHEPLQQVLGQPNWYAWDGVRRQHQQRRALGERPVLGAVGPDGQSATRRSAGHGPVPAGRGHLGRRDA